MMNHAGSLIFLALLAMNRSFAQQESCRVSLPVGIIGTDGSLLSGLTGKDITVRLRKQALPIEAVGYDTSSRRILFIIDTSRQLPPDARKAETTLVNSVMEKARSGDSFALLTARGALRQVRFEEGQDKLKRAVDELAADPRERAKAETVLDTVMRGIDWFGEQRPGDAMLIMADHLEESYSTAKIQDGFATNVAPNFEKSHVDFKTVASALSAHKIRVFGLQFSALTISPFTYQPGNENLLGITLGSGGYLLVDAIDPHGSYVLTDMRLRSLQHRVFQVYGAISQFYTLAVTAPMPLRNETWNLELAKDLQKNTLALSPRRFDSCQAAKP